jgi:hypothetical protein
MEHPYYTFFLESEIQKFYTRIEIMEQILWKQFLYPLGDPEYIDYHLDRSAIRGGGHPVI